MNTSKPDYDIAIIGGGLIGHSLIASLAPAIQNGLKVAVIESNKPITGAAESYSPAFDDRATAISLGSSILFHNWGLWQELSLHATQVSNIQVSEKSRFQTLVMKPELTGQPLGYIVPNSWLGQCLVKNSQKLGIDSIYGSLVTRVIFKAEYATIKMREHQQISAKLVVLADGGRSDIKQQLGILTDALDFGQTALIANITTDQPHNNQAFERFTEIGPMAMLPLTMNNLGNTSALVWSLSPEKAAQIKTQSEREFLRFGSDMFGTRLGHWTGVSNLSSYPLIRKYSAEQVRSRLVLLGNTALSLHPVAGQGFNIGLRAVSALSSQIAQSLTEHEDVGRLSGLLKFAARIENDQKMLMAFCDSLIRVYENPMLQIPRAVALGLLDHHVISKSAFSQIAMGMAPGQLFERNR